MRTLPLLLPLIVVSTGAQAQYAPWGYAPYPQYYRPPPAPSYAPPPMQSLSQEMLAAHNAIRARVGERPLVWSPQVATVAQDWANRLLATGAFSHRPDNRYGENLYTISGASASVAEVVNAWAAEERGYDIRSNACAGVCGHYTQLVWANTRAVGCAVAASGYRQVWVCDYDPPGNIIGERPY
jgi:pathogenesis-related protein 1